MHPAIAALTPQQANAFWGSPFFELWLEDQGLQYSGKMVSDLVERALEEKAPPRDDPRRTDGKQLRELVEKAARLPPRLRALQRMVTARAAAREAERLEWESSFRHGDVARQEGPGSRTA